MSATAAAKENEPHLASLVKAGSGQVAAEQIAGFIFMVHDISNLYLVTTSDGDVLINTGFLNTGERNKALLAPHRTGPLRRIILTQSHADHFGGLDSFREPETAVIAHKDFHINKYDSEFLHSFFNPRVRKLWGTIVKMDEQRAVPPKVMPDIHAEIEYSFEQGGRRFEVIWTPGGETLDSLCVWLPKEKVLFTGNLFGPVFLSMPFLNTLRGDKPRLVRNYLNSLDIVRKLGAEILITGHGQPVQGAARIRTDLDKMHDAVSWVRDYTLAGMNAGKDVNTLVSAFKFPPELQIGEFHGKGSWAVRSIWHEYSGWFFYDSTTSLYGVPRSCIDSDLAELAGGVDVLAARAQHKLGEDKPLEAMHFVDIALGAEPTSVRALTVKRDILHCLLKLSGGQNLSETMWLRSEIAETERKLASAA